MGGELFVRASAVRLTALGFQLHPICVQINELLEKACALSIPFEDAGRLAAQVARQAGEEPDAAESQRC